MDDALAVEVGDAEAQIAHPADQERRRQRARHREQRGRGDEIPAGSVGRELEHDGDGEALLDHAVAEQDVRVLHLVHQQHLVLHALHLPLGQLGALVVRDGLQGHRVARVPAQVNLAEPARAQLSRHGDVARRDFELLELPVALLLLRGVAHQLPQLVQAADEPVNVLLHSLHGSHDLVEFRLAGLDQLGLLLRDGGELGLHQRRVSVGVEHDLHQLGVVAFDVGLDRLHVGA